MLIKLFYILYIQAKLGFVYFISAQSSEAKC